ncbi:MAG TPA: DNA gyrase subunit A [bacterium]|nr:DNA gyrase subunit A [bacterium]HPL95603.1 DNA gyrase subunit A [bacterium]
MKDKEPKKPLTTEEDAAPLNKLGKIKPRPISAEMQESYLDYAMSVIVSRALPDVRDGLKPVHRRILYAMWNIGLKAAGKFRKSATVVGEVLGKYHPHGDQAVYDSMVRMAQDFAMRYPLIHGQGNFGSMDGDGAAAMRYTEAKLSAIAEEMLFDLEKNTVDWQPNFDGSQKEPKVLPSKLPNLLLDGTMGIAVGMATEIPPHNLTELIDGICHLAENPEADLEDLMQFIKGPDFPTGGIIYNIEDIKQAYATGKGGVVMRAQTEIVENKNNAFSILVTEVPYQMNKAVLLEKIAELVKDKKIEGIKDLRDESNKDGVRVVIELKKDAYPKKILNQLFSHTDLQTTFHFNVLALVDGIQPRVLTLKMVLEEYLKHRREVIKRRTEFDLDRAKDRAHILEGLMLALHKIDEVIKTIKKSRDREEAKINLIKNFRLSERQAIAILEMKLSQLANLEQIRLETELKDKKKLIAELEEILKSPKKITKIITDELKNIKEKFGDARRTKIMPKAVGEFSQEDLIPDETAIIMVTRDGYIKRLPPDTFKTQGRGGKGVAGVTTKEEDVVEHLFSTTTHKDLLFFTTKGRVFQLKTYEVPVASRVAKGQSIVNFLQLAPGENVSAVLHLDGKEKYQFLVMVTQNGTIKKVDLQEFKNIRRSGLIAIKLKEGDNLKWVKPIMPKDELLITTLHGNSIRFKEKDVRPMGRSAAGVRGIRLKGKDHVVNMNVISAEDNKGTKLLVVTSEGFGKLSDIKEYRLQGRGGSGIKAVKITSKTGQLVWANTLKPQSLSSDVVGDLMIISDKGQVIRLPLTSVPEHGRATQGVRLMRFKEIGDKVASVTLV